MYDDHYLPRPDAKTAQQVDNGIQIQHASGTLNAAAYLQRKGVPLNVALRVLSRPWRRRGGYQLSTLQPEEQEDLPVIS